MIINSLPLTMHGGVSKQTSNCSGSQPVAHNANYLKIRQKKKIGVGGAIKNRYQS